MNVVVKRPLNAWTVLLSIIIKDVIYIVESIKRQLSFWHRIIFDIIETKWKKNNAEEEEMSANFQ